MVNKKKQSCVLLIGTFVVANCLHAMDEVGAVNPFIRTLIAKMGIQAPVAIEQGDENSYDNRLIASLAENTPLSHRILLTSDTLHHLRTTSLSFDAQHHLAEAWVCHELGHAKHIENDRHHVRQMQAIFAKQVAIDVRRVQQIQVVHQKNHHLPVDAYHETDQEIVLIQTQSKKEMDALSSDEYLPLIHSAELYADAAIPNEKPVLLAMRDWLCNKHEELRLTAFEGLIGKQALDRFNSEDLKNLKIIPAIDFSVPMDERYAKTWDALHKDLGDYHPSFYRRAYMFNERIKALEVQEREEEYAQHTTTPTRDSF